MSHQYPITALCFWETTFLLTLVAPASLLIPPLQFPYRLDVHDDRSRPELCQSATMDSWDKQSG